ncbi:dockerin type I domain-containing protein [Stieleria sp. TO1_6]|uniref:dockerin type I domain-containing protein n=1 Tax=Stieleria tagensis TaxID=2956795 RepID=UPI00209B89B5|nr:dockerin type I domain-containing protein [Stieleria tagensis]MCO8120954.1 dockerin type I domain-containing protein [Stieleria tagensis]
MTTNNPAASPRPIDAGDSAGSASKKSAKRGRRRRRLVFERLGQRRVLAVITGAVFNDVDGSLRAEASEVGLGSRLAYIDANENATLDADERFALTDADGQFRFEGLDKGTYPVRLFSGSAAQRQTFPAGVSQKSLPASFEQSIGGFHSGDQLQVLADGALLQIQTTGTRTSEFPLNFVPSELVTTVGAGQVSSLPVSLVAGSTDLDGASQSGLWWVPSGDGQTQQVFAASGQVSAAVGTDGLGLLLAAGEDESLIHAIRIGADTDASAEASPAIEIEETPFSVPLGAQLVTTSTAIDLTAESDFGSRSILAWPVATTNGATQFDSQDVPSLKASIWSNRAAGWVAGSETVLVGATELVSFDDAAGLLAVRYAHGNIGVLDVDANFAELHQFAPMPGPLALIPGFDALASVSTIDSETVFSLLDVRDGKRLVTQALPTTGLGAPQAMIVGDSLSPLFLLGETGVATIRLDQPTEHRVVVQRDDDIMNIEFGALRPAENQSPVAVDSLSLDAIEDKQLSISASEMADWVVDSDQDRLISLIVQSPEHGKASVGSDGELNYVPDQDFNGSDSFSIQFHDGQSVSDPITVSVEVASRPDIPRAVRLAGAGIPEHTEGRYRVGALEIEDPDVGDVYELSVSDSRFRIEDQTLVLVNGGLNFEYEPEILLEISGFDRDANEYFGSDVVVYIEDENDPVTELWAVQRELFENDFGAYVATLDAFDEDFDQVVTFSVDDNRFQTEGNKLRLKEDIAIDYEAETLIVLNVTADDGAGSSKSTEVRIPVMDVPEQVGEITLSNETVMEWESGASVGDVQLDGVVAADSYHLSVDDPRFEIDGSLLKLLDGQMVLRSDAEQIELTITAQDSSGIFAALSETFVIEVLENESPFHNDDNPYDVDGNGNVTPLDALAIINYLNLYGPGPVGPGDTGYGYDVNGDGQVSALDALLVINFLNTLQNNGGAVGNHDAENNADSNEPADSNQPADGVDSHAVRGAIRSHGIAPPAAAAPLAQNPTGPINDAPLEAGAADQDTANGDSERLPSQQADEVTDWLREINRDDKDDDLQLAIDELLRLLDSH